MKYKVGDRARVRSDLKVGKGYGEHAFMHDMFKFRGKIVTIESVWKQGYRIEEDTYWWTDEMLEPVEEMSAEEAIRLYAKMCKDNNCYACPVYKKSGECGCEEFAINHPEEVIESLKQWKADHERKPIETEFIYIVRIIEDKQCVHEEEIVGESEDEAQERVLKKYCEDHEGKFYAVAERICRVKE